MLGDLLFVQHELTDQVLDYYDTYLLGRLESRGGELADRLNRLRGRLVNRLHFLGIRRQRREAARGVSVVTAERPQ